MSDLQFRFATDILRRLGEELNPSPDQGILELVKNSYDADAVNCVVTLSGSEQSDGVVQISDDGEGMTWEQLRDGWFVLGRSVKVANAPTRLGRLPAGNKGLGRLAALRLGREVDLVTRPSSRPDAEYDLTIDWSDFDKVDLVEEANVNVEERPRTTSDSGTRITLRGLRTDLGRMDVKRLARSMVLLADPFGEDPSGFHPVLETKEFADLAALVQNRYFSDADYHLTGVLMADGRASATVADQRGEPLYEADHSDLSKDRKGRLYMGPPCTFDLWTFRLSAEAFRMRATTVAEVREWLTAFGGVHVYVNGLRVAPYGNPGDDWLEMNLRRVRNPEERPGTNTSIGRISVRDAEERLVQKTDRSGFVESEAFIDLRLFAQDCMEFMARRRLEEAERRRSAERAQASKHSERSRQNLERAIGETKGPQKQALEGAFRRYERARNRETDALRREIQLYRTLSTAGITTATFAHESAGSPLKVIAQAIGSIERRTKGLLGPQYDERLAELVASTRRSVAALAVLSSATLRLLDHDKRRWGRVEIHPVIRDVLKTFDPFMAARNVALDLQLDEGEPYLRGTPAAVESIVTNLLNNSLAAFERGTAKKRTIEIATKVDERSMELRVSDNGPGIKDISLRDIWLPGETTTANGTGLGLAIVRDTVVDLGGDVEAVANGHLGGAEIIVRLPTLGA